MILLKFEIQNQNNEPTKQKRIKKNRLTKTENKLPVAREVKRIKRHKLSVIKVMEKKNYEGAESRWRRNRTGDHFLFYKFIERTTER